MQEFVRLVSAVLRTGLFALFGINTEATFSRTAVCLAVSILQVPGLASWEHEMDK